MIVAPAAAAPVFVSDRSIWLGSVHAARSSMKNCIFVPAGAPGMTIVPVTAASVWAIVPASLPV
ncbi:hypothetical protein HYN69_00410 [Gemmobacter aquarius]|uniref:Uncharacterized protein n=1 Tax=Paragemmobacter aquarius TaxID=2169400 RepID=A0A2S0UH87_9RHOB|nr:hypothetical protein HYN69_00410 [Gemmobacter aquarius]